jgi:hypothetical protein
MSNNVLKRFGNFIFPGGNPLYDEEDNPKIAALKTKMAENPELAGLYQSEIDAQKTHDMQEFMNIAATSGASSGGTGVQHGQGMPYAQLGNFRETQPTPITKEEEDEWKGLRAPGFGNNFGMKPFRMYT